MLGLILNSAGPYPHRKEILAILLDMSFWNVIKTKCYQNGMCSFGKFSFGLNIEYDQNGLCSFGTVHTVILSD